MSLMLPIYSTSFFIMMMMSLLFPHLMELASKTKEKKYSFECGFNSISMKKTSFSTNFLLLTMMFLIFDVEIFILIPFIQMSKFMEKNVLFISLIFIIILTVILLKEWIQGSLEWSY